MKNCKKARRQAERKQRKERPAAHRRDVADIHRHSFATEQLRRGDEFRKPRPGRIVLDFAVELLFEVIEQKLADVLFPEAAPLGNRQCRAACIEDLAVVGNVLRPCVIDVYERNRGGGRGAAVLPAAAPRVRAGPPGVPGHRRRDRARERRQAGQLLR